MVIEKIHINCFGNIENRDFDFCDGVNIVEGLNESGKSTLAAFIKFVFYGLSAKSSDGALCERERYVNWHSGSADGYMTVRTRDGRYRIERVIMSAGQMSDSGANRTVYREGVTVTDLANNSPLKIKCEPGEYFFALDCEVFSKTAFVSQLDGAKVTGEKMTQAIENILFSADENVNIQKALKKLDASRVALLHKNGKGGKIYELEKNRGELEEKLEAAKRRNADILAKESSLEDAKEKMQALETAREALAAAVKNFENAAVVSLFDKLHLLETKAEENSEREREFYESRRRNGFVPDREYAERLFKLGSLCKTADAERESTFALLQESKNKCAELEGSLNSGSGGRRSPAEDLETAEKHKNIKKHLCVWTAALLAAAAGTAAAGIALGANLWEYIGTIVTRCAFIPVLLALVCGILAFIRNSHLKKLYREYNASDYTGFNSAVNKLMESVEKLETEREEEKRLESKYAESEAAAKRAHEEFRQNAQKWSADAESDSDSVIRSAEKAVSELEAIKAEGAKINEMLSLLKGQLGQYDEGAARAAAVDSDCGVNAENIASNRRELELITMQSRALETRIHELDKELAGLRPLCENPAKIAEKIELADSYIRSYRIKHEAYMLACAKISEAGEGMRESISPKLADYTCRLMSALTNGKYSEIGVDNNLALSVNAGGGTRNLEYLSAGTQDAAYVSLRLALINTLFRKNLPTVIFDESFCKLDSTRLESMMRLVSTLDAGKMQSIILTSCPRDAEAMDKCGAYRRIVM